MALSDDPSSPCFFLNVSYLRGNTVTLILPEPGDLSPQALNLVTNGDAPTPDNPLYANLYHEELRPRYHFSSKRGWLNDPNGLLYANGVYHLFYQHNPLGTPHGGVNNSWGHAVSPDLIRWNELDDAISPWRRDWNIGSGSAILDERNDLGYGANAIIAAFTALGARNEIPGRAYASGGQFLAVSRDEGKTFRLVSTQAVVPDPCGKGWRDPCLFWHEDHYVMAVYETADGHNCISIYTSADLRHWDCASRNMDLYECPDLFELCTREGEKRWVLFGADGRARIGAFDGYRFTESGESNLLDYAKCTYASQTWKHHPNGDRIHIGWIFGMDGWTPENSFPNMPFSQCMSVPCELSLQKHRDGFRVLRNPIAGIRELRDEHVASGSFNLNGLLEFPLDSPADYELRFSSAEKLHLRVGMHEVWYDPDNRLLSFDNGEKAELTERDLSLRLLTDTTTMELFFGEGISAAFSIHPTARSLRVSGKGAVCYRAWKLKSIWDA